MRVGYIDGYNPKWKVGMQVLVVFASFAISILIAIILVIRKQYQDLLFNMMPPQIISKLRKGETIVQMYDNATVYFSDIVEFTTLSGVLSPLEIMQMLNEMYTEFDHLVRKHGVYKVETIGDAYLVIGGGPEEGNNSSVEGAKRVAMFALDVMKYVQDYRTKNEMQIYIRSGLASGPVVGGVIGITSPKFSLFGETVNVASRMESTSKKMRIQCSMQTYNLLRNARNVTFNLVRRTEDATEEGIYIKGKGNQKTWWINGVESS
jgi:class 3 adenylate cyclase